MAASAKVTPIKPAAFVVEVDAPPPSPRGPSGIPDALRALAAAPMGASVFFPGLPVGGVHSRLPPKLRAGQWITCRTENGGVRVWKTAEPKTPA